MNSKNILLTLLLLVCTIECKRRPAIGILSVPNSTNRDDGSSIPASVVKWIENAGSDAFLIPYDLPPTKIKRLFSLLNGIIITGNEKEERLNTNPKTLYNLSSRFLYNLTKSTESTVPTPLLGIGRGFNLLCIYGSGLSSLRLPRFSAPYTLTTPLTFTQAGLSSYLFGNLTFGVVHSFATERIAPHWTREGVTREHFEGLSQRFTHVNQLVLSNMKLSSRFVALSTTQYSGEIDFVDTMESRSGAFFAVQWRPQDNLYGGPTDVEWSRGGIRASQTFARKFVAKTKEKETKKEFLREMLIRRFPYKFVDGMMEYTFPSFEHCDEDKYPICRK